MLGITNHTQWEGHPVSHHCSSLSVPFPTGFPGPFTVCICVVLLTSEGGWGSLGEAGTIWWLVVRSSQELITVVCTFEGCWLVDWIGNLQICPSSSRGALVVCVCIWCKVITLTLDFLIKSKGGALNRFPLFRSCQNVSQVGCWGNTSDLIWRGGAH